ncbi:hypothetical protein CBR_g30932 [Chara braunii]|uniref:DNA primase n=1 Tax=Chara braunii TaxID=69332 RepID=A0A388LDT5_CHABU|nr:hypothetical protein CBR_g30932 [Chara braunii]|eukprot:GBG80470.1 hypothetical protein CBR_g30932 [Chara braunii]
MVERVRKDDEDMVDAAEMVGTDDDRHEVREARGAVDRIPTAVGAAGDHLLLVEQYRGFDADLMRMYYARLFPYQEMYKWLSYGHDRKHPQSDMSFFARREFSFTLDNDIYIRYQSFKNCNDMEAAIRDKCPFKIDIGAVFNFDPSKRQLYHRAGSEKTFAPVERELVFDVDISDYDDVRVCCKGADVCNRCWPLMTVVIRVLDTALREDFGFMHILWVYSGRRGVHCWVCDPRARRLGNDQRSAIAEYFRVYKGSENNAVKVALPGPSLHPSLSRAYEQVLERFFIELILPGQELLADKESWEKVLCMIPDNDVRNQLRIRWSSRRQPNGDVDVNVQRWKDLEKCVKASKVKTHGMRRCLDEIIFVYTYPRLDFEVSKSMNHLLKAPFCVHPKTGRVCVPIDPQACEDFDPTTVPTVSQLLNELNTACAEETAGKTVESVKDFERTSMREAVEIFRSTFLDGLYKSCRAELDAAHIAKVQASSELLKLAW